jgi:hypothetical protein
MCHVGQKGEGLNTMTNSVRTAIAAFALAILLSSARADPALTAEISSPDGSGIAPKNIIFDDDYALYADGMAAHYILLDLERPPMRACPF